MIVQKKMSFNSYRFTSTKTLCVFGILFYTNKSLNVKKFTYLVKVAASGFFIWVLIIVTTFGYILIIPILLCYKKELLRAYVINNVDPSLLKSDTYHVYLCLVRNKILIILSKKRLHLVVVPFLTTNGRFLCRKIPFQMSQLATIYTFLMVCK